MNAAAGFQLAAGVHHRFVFVIAEWL